MLEVSDIGAMDVVLDKPEKKVHGYQKEIRELAIRVYADGLNFRQIGRHL